MVGWIWVAAAAHAGPTVEVESSGAILGRLVVSAPASEVHALLADPEDRAAAIAGDATTAATPDGDCFLEEVHAPHPIKAVAYTVRTCTTATTVRSTLVSSDDLARFESEWTVTDAQPGTEIVYRLDVAPSFPVPGFVVRASTKKAVANTLAALARHFD